METPTHDSAGHEPAQSSHSNDTSIPRRSLPAGFVGWKEAARISGIGITAWKRWLAEGKVTCWQWFTRPGGGRVRIYSVEGIQQMMQQADVAFPPKGTVDRHEAARMFGVAERTFSTWEKEGRIGCGRLVSVPGKAAQYKVYPVEELQHLAEGFRREEKETAKRMEPYPDPDRQGVVRVPVFTQKHKGMEAIIDADDLPLVQGKRWNWSPGRADGSNGGSVTWCGQATPLGRIIMGVTDPEMLVSHVNGDRLDYRRENLVVRTRSEVALAANRPVKWEGVEPYADPERPEIVRVPVQTEKHKGMEALIDASDLPKIQGKRWNWSPAKSNGGSVVLLMRGTPNRRWRGPFLK